MRSLKWRLPSHPNSVLHSLYIGSWGVEFNVHDFRSLPIPEGTPEPPAFEAGFAFLAQADFSDLLQILACQLHVLEDFQKQSRPDQFSGMNRDNGISPVLMA